MPFFIKKAQSAQATVSTSNSVHSTILKEGAVVQIVQDGTVIREIDLSRVARAYSFEVESADGGRNTILVEPGRICVSEADCPDQICVHHAVSCHGDGVRNVYAVVHVDVAVVQLNGRRCDIILRRNMCDAAARKHKGCKCC